MNIIDDFFILNEVNPCYIITWVDLDIAVSENLLQKYIYEICEKNADVLQLLLIDNSKKVSKNRGHFDITDYYELHNMDSRVFSSCVDELLNTPIDNYDKNNLDWLFVCLSTSGKRCTQEVFFPKCHTNSQSRHV